MTEKSINTIADLKFDLLLESKSFKDFKEEIFEINPFYEEEYDKILVENGDRKIKNGMYTINIQLVNNRYQGFNTKSTFEYVNVRFKVKSKNYKLKYFLYLVYKEISKKVEEYNDWHIFLKGFNKIDDFEYEVILGS